MSEEEKTESKITEMTNKEPSAKMIMSQEINRQRQLLDKLMGVEKKLISREKQLKLQTEIVNTKKKIEATTEGGNEEEISMLNLELQQAQDRLEEIKGEELSKPSGC
mmetsp:Transcript_44819/g.51527  ORF Transcript_44819/g.51527 Transcript_44819/m.51527 type:complete len:107 (+) Transcript_44819:198-518(+)